MRVRLHVGPPGTGTARIQQGSLARRETLAGAGILSMQGPGKSDGIPKALIALDVERALREFDRLFGAARDEVPRARDAHTLLYSSDVFFQADSRLKPDFERAFASFLEGLASRGHDVDVVFVERPIEDLLMSHALLQASLGDLRYVSADPGAFLEYVDSYAWLKGVYFARCPVLHLDFNVLDASGDLFSNFMKASCGIDVPPVGAAKDDETVTDRHVARGLLMAPLVNWMELFGSVSRADLINAAHLKPPIPDGLLDESAASIPLLRDCLRATARRAIEMYVKRHAAVAP